MKTVLKLEGKLYDMISDWIWEIKYKLQKWDSWKFGRKLSYMKYSLFNLEINYKLPKSCVKDEY